MSRRGSLTKLKQHESTQQSLARLDLACDVIIELEPPNTCAEVCGVLKVTESKVNFKQSSTEYKVTGIDAYLPQVVLIEALVSSKITNKTRCYHCSRSLSTIYCIYRKGINTN